jgi:hypothetical protein
VPTKPDDAAPNGGAAPNDQERPSTGKSPARGPTAGKPGTADVPVTEKPVPAKRSITRYTVSVDDATGHIVKIEKLDEKTNQSRELTQSEYAAAYSFASSAAPYYAASTAALHDPLNSPAMQAYFRGIADYIRAITGYR